MTVKAEKREFIRCATKHCTRRALWYDRKSKEYMCNPCFDMFSNSTQFDVDFIDRLSDNEKDFGSQNPKGVEHLQERAYFEIGMRPPVLI